MLILTEGEGGHRAYVGHLTSVAFPSVGMWLRAWASGWGCGHLEVGWLRRYKHLFWINKTPPLSTHFPYKLIKFFMLWRLCGFLIHDLAFRQTIKHWNEYFPSIDSKKLHLFEMNGWCGNALQWGYLIWFYPLCRSCGGDFYPNLQMPHIQQYMYAWGIPPPLTQKYNDTF